MRGSRRQNKPIFFFGIAYPLRRGNLQDLEEKIDPGHFKKFSVPVSRDYVLRNFFAVAKARQLDQRWQKTHRSSKPVLVHEKLRKQTTNLLALVYAFYISFPILNSSP